MHSTTSPFITRQLIKSQKQKEIFSFLAVTIKIPKNSRTPRTPSSPRISRTKIHHKLKQFASVLSDSLHNHHHRTIIFAIQARIRQPQGRIHHDHEGLVRQRRRGIEFELNQRGRGACTPIYFWFETTTKHSPEDQKGFKKFLSPSLSNLQIKPQVNM